MTQARWIKCTERIRTESANTVNECRVNFCFLPAKDEIFIRTAKFLQKFIAFASENSLCTLFVSDERQQLHGIFMQFGKNIQTACQLRSAVYSNFFDN